MRRLILGLILTTGVAAAPLAAQTAGTPVPAPVVTQPAEYAQTFHLAHARAQEVQQLLLTLMNQASPGTRPRITMSQDTNSLSVRATEPVMKVVESIIRANDVPQTPPTLRTPTAAPAPQGGRGQAPPQGPQAPAAPQQQSRLPNLPTLPNTTNIQLELTITDTLNGTPTNKTVSMVILNGSSGMIRTAGATNEHLLNVDAVASAYQNGMIGVRLSFEFTPPPSGGVEGRQTVRAPRLNESLTVVVLDGKPLVVSQSADAASDRKVTASITAKVLKF